MLTWKIYIALVVLPVPCLADFFPPCGPGSSECFSIVGFGTTTISAEVIAQAGAPFFDTSASATINTLGSTSGPIRPGYINFFEQGSNVDGNAAQGMQVNIGGYACNGFLACNLPTGFLPFTLGETFSIFLTATVSGGSTTKGGGAGGDYKFSIYEQETSGSVVFPGAEVTIQSTPEPSPILNLGTLAILFGLYRLLSRSSTLLRWNAPPAYPKVF